MISLPVLLKGKKKCCNLPLNEACRIWAIYVLKTQISCEIFVWVSNSGKKAYQRELALAYEIPVTQYLDSQYPNIFLLNNKDNCKCPNAPDTKVREAEIQLILRTYVCIIISLYNHQIEHGIWFSWCVPEKKSKMGIQIINQYISSK